MRSPWLIHTCRAKGSSAKSRTTKVSHLQEGRPILAVLSSGHTPAEIVSQQLHTVADAQDRQPALEDKGGQPGSIWFVDAVGSTTQDKAAWFEGQYLLGRRVIAEQLAVDVGFAHPPGNELAVLRAKVQDGDSFAGGCGWDMAAITRQR